MDTDTSVDTDTSGPDSPSLYERHPKRCDIAEGTIGIALGVLTLFTRPSIEVVVTQGNGNQPSAANWAATLLTLFSMLDLD